MKVFANLIIFFSFVCLLTPALLPYSYSHDIFQSKSIQEKKSFTLQQTFLLFDYEARRLYWFYLRRAKTILRRKRKSGETILLLFLYRNFLGTFLCTGSWSINRKQISVQTMVRLGSGSGSKDMTEQELEVKPWMINYRLEKDENQIIRDGRGNFRIVGKNIDEQIKVKNQTEKQRKKQLLDSYVRINYRKVMKNGKLLESSYVATNRNTFIILTYVVESYYYFVLSKMEQKQIIILVLLRVGNLVLKQKSQVRVKIDPKIIDINKL